jgi:hypothetical protein
MVTLGDVHVLVGFGNHREVARFPLGFITHSGSPSSLDVEELQVPVKGFCAFERLIARDNVPRVVDQDETLCRVALHGFANQLAPSGRAFIGVASGGSELGELQNGRTKSNNARPRTFLFSFRRSR